MSYIWARIEGKVEENGEIHTAVYNFFLYIAFIINVNIVTRSDRPIFWARSENANRKMGGKTHSTENLWSIHTIV